MSSPLTDLVGGFQDLIAQLPPLLQPFVVAGAGAVPFIEGEGAAVIGIVGGIHPVIAAVAAATGNFVCVALLVLLGAGVRTAVTAGRGGTVPEPSARRQKFQRAFARYGVPGVSLLGPLLLPTHFTAVMLAGVGVSKGRILFWQAVAIAGWTTVFTLIATGILSAVWAG